MTDTADWHRVAASDDLEEGGMIPVRLGERDLALYRVEGRVYATGNICTHGLACLTDGYLDGHMVECPLHQGLFDVRTGAPQGPPVTEPVPVYEARDEGGDILVKG
jgi:naphthalene 1,2-dioxygenase system ferredoxin subunit